MKYKDETLVTIGIPFFNASKYLFDSIQSVLNQSYTNWELILLDDGSTDDSVEIAKSFNDDRIVVISDGINKGLIFRLNQLTSLANGKFYARMDADDIMHFERIKTQLNYLNEFPNIDIVGSSYYSIDKNNFILGETILIENPDSVNTIMKFGCFAHPSILGRTKWFIDNPYSDKWERMEDFELWIRTVSINNFRNISEPLLFYRNIGIPTLKKYVKSNLGIVRLLLFKRRYKIKLIDRFLYSIRYTLKIFVYFVFFIFGRLDKLVQKRSKPISENKLKEINKILQISIKQ